MFSKSTQILLSVSSKTTEQTRLRECIGERRNCIFVQSESEATSLIESCLHPSLIILDADLPADGAVRLFKMIKCRTELEDIPAIFIIPDDSSREAYYLSLGAADVIRRPFTDDVLRSRIEKALSNQYLNNYLIQKIYTYKDSLAEEHKRLVVHTKEIMNALTSTIDAKDTYTKGHSIRVAEYSSAIGKAMGFDEKMVEIIYQAGLLHDIGKIGVADYILRKPGTLDDNEFTTIKNHPLIGYQILSSLSETPLISYGAKWHHERYDGKGYPDGLARDEIPLISRIISVADAYDAMTSIRAYRKPLSANTAKEEIMRCAGTQFDPEVARIACNIIDKNSTLLYNENTDKISLSSLASPFKSNIRYA